MPLYNSAKAPAVPKFDDGTTQEALTDNSTGTAGDSVEDVGASFDQGTLNDNFATLAAKIEALIDHMNDGRT